MISHTRFEELYREYWRLVFALCRARLDNEDDALDAAQEVFVRKWQAIGSYDPSRATFKTWLSRNAERVCIDAWRRRSTRDKHSQDLEVSTEEATYAPDGDQQAAISFYLSRLGPLDRQVLLMHEVEGYTWEEIAELTNMTVSQVRTRVERAIRQLRGCLEG